MSAANEAKSSENEQDLSFLSLTDLAQEKLGGQVLYVTDEFFAPASWLLKEGRGDFCVGKFTEFGQYMEGWESRRHNPDHDWCIIRLGVPGIIHGFDIDTNHFHGNYGEWAMVEACCRDDNPSVESLVNSKEWEEILTKSALVPGTHDKGHNYFGIKNQQRWTHVRLHMYPDGGIARFRVYGQVVPDWSLFDQEETINIAAIELGAQVLASSNSYFSHKENLIMPGRGKNMGDGWETKRRRGPGNDWAVIKLGCNGYIRRILLDTAHFKGNYPDTVVLEGAFLKEGESWEHAKWTLIRPSTKTFPNTEHHWRISSELRSVEFNHIKLSVYPDGGVSRLKVFGKRIPGDSVAGVDDKFNGAKLYATPLTAEDYAPFGKVIEINPNNKQVQANQGTAQRFDWLTPIENLRPATAKLNVSTFRCKPQRLPFDIKLLERHPYSTQMFIPMTCPQRYLVIVATGANLPDLNTIKAFVAHKGQGITYAPGVWHHPMVALDDFTDFMMQVWEDNTDDDCHAELLKDTIRCYVN